MSTLKTNSVEPINNSTNFTIKSGVGSPTRITATTTGDVNIGSAAAPIDSLAVHSTTAHTESNAVLEVTNANTNIAGGVNLANFMASGDSNGYHPRLIVTANNSGIILKETFNNTANNLMFQIGNVEMMRLNGTGLGVLNANPGKALDVTGEIRASGDITTGASLVVANGATLSSTSNTGAVLSVKHTNSTLNSLNASVHVSANTSGTYHALSLQNADNTSGLGEVVLSMPVYDGTSGLNIRQSSTAQGPSSWAGSGYDAIIRTGKSSSKLHFAGGSNAGPFLTVATNGVGIGTTTPGQSLDVIGGVRVGDFSMGNVLAKLNNTATAQSTPAVGCVIPLLVHGTSSNTTPLPPGTWFVYLTAPIAGLGVAESVVMAKIWTVYPNTYLRFKVSSFAPDIPTSANNIGIAYSTANTTAVNASGTFTIMTDSDAYFSGSTQFALSTLLSAQGSHKGIVSTTSNSSIRVLSGFAVRIS
jgi:hypothetical protein